MFLLVSLPNPLPLPVPPACVGHQVPHLLHFVPGFTLSDQIQLLHVCFEHVMYARPHCGFIVPVVGLRIRRESSVGCGSGHRTRSGLEGILSQRDNGQSCSTGCPEGRRWV